MQFDKSWGRAGLCSRPTRCVLKRNNNKALRCGLACLPQLSINTDKKEQKSRERNVHISERLGCKMHRANWYRSTRTFFSRNGHLFSLFLFIYLIKRLATRAWIKNKSWRFKYSRRSIYSATYSRTRSSLADFFVFLLVPPVSSVFWYCEESIESREQLIWVYERSLTSRRRQNSSNGALFDAVRSVGGLGSSGGPSDLSPVMCWLWIIRGGNILINYRNPRSFRKPAR